MAYYILDENDCPVAVTMAHYHLWHQAINDDIKTGIGFKLARTESERVAISTVYLGIDHSHSNDGPPVLWETMAFFGDGEDCERSTSRSEAMEVHKRFCEKYIPESVGD